MVYARGISGLDHVVIVTEDLVCHNNKIWKKICDSLVCHEQGSDISVLQKNEAAFALVLSEEKCLWSYRGGGLDQAKTRM